MIWLHPLSTLRCNYISLVTVPAMVQVFANDFVTAALILSMACFKPEADDPQKIILLLKVSDSGTATLA